MNITRRKWNASGVGVQSLNASACLGVPNCHGGWSRPDLVHPELEVASSTRQPPSSSASITHVSSVSPTRHTCCSDANTIQGTPSHWSLRRSPCDCAAAARCDSVQPTVAPAPPSSGTRTVRRRCQHVDSRWCGVMSVDVLLCTDCGHASAVFAAALSTLSMVRQDDVGAIIHLIYNKVSCSTRVH